MRWFLFPAFVVLFVCLIAAWLCCAVGALLTYPLVWLERRPLSLGDYVGELTEGVLT